VTSRNSAKSSFLGRDRGAFGRARLSPSRATLLRAILFAATWILFACSGPRWVQAADTDKVTLQREGSTSRILLSGQILDYTGHSLKFRTTAGNAVRLYPASQVVSVETPQTDAHIKGLLDFSQKQIDDARAEFKKALTLEPRTWVRREILAMLVRCDLRMGDYKSAGLQFQILFKSDPTTRHFKLIPLIWAPQHSDVGLKNTAQNWISQPTEILRLMGACVLFGDAKYGDEATNELKKLTISTDRRIHYLAEAQLRRTRLSAGNITRHELQRWQNRIESMPEALRGGPYYVLGRAHLQRQEHERAALALLWLPLVYDHDHHLAARACLEAADALARIGQKTNAGTLYREVAARYPQTPFAQEASEILRTTSSNQSGR